MKIELCTAFCDGIIVSKVKVGLAVSTAFVRGDGDKVSFYVIDVPGGQVRLEDDGATVPTLEAAGVDFTTETRARAIEELLGGAEAFFDEEEMLIKTEPFDRDAIGEKALRFVAALVRFEDFLLLTEERVASTFKQDAALAIRDEVGDSAKIEENTPFAFDSVKPDMVLRAPERRALAVFLGNSPNRVHDAIFLQMAANEANEDIAVIALLERKLTISNDLYQRVTNRVTSVGIWEGDEKASVSRIGREVVGISVH